MKHDGIWDGSLTCFDAHTGTVRWSHRYDHPCFATPLYADGQLWVSCGDVVRCQDSTNGQEIWAYHPEHFSLYGRLVVAQGRLFAPDIDGWTYVLDPDSGAFLDRFLPPRGTGFSSDGRTIYAACGMRGLRAFDPLTCAERWSFHRPGSYFAGCPTLRGTDLVVASSDGNVYVVGKRDGCALWGFQFGNVGGATVALDGERGYLITGDGELLAFACPAEKEGPYGGL
jgi:outer membrane protein assembly factor BamB